MNKQERILLLVLALVQFTNIMDFMIMMPLGPQLMRLFDISPQQFSILVSSYTFTAGIVGFLFSFFIDQFDRKKALQLAYIGFTLGTFACALSPSYQALIAARIFTGIFGGILGAITLSIVGDAFSFERRAAAMGIVMSAFAAASVFGVPFGLFLATAFSWHMPFMALGSAGIVISLLVYLYVPEMRMHIEEMKPDSRRFDSLRRILNNRNQLAALSLMMLIMLGQFTIIPFIAPYMVSNVGFEEHQLMYIYLLGGAATLITSPLVGKASDKYGKPLVFKIFAVLSVIPLFLITNMPAVPIVWVLIVTTLFFIFISGRGIPATTMISGTVEPGNRGSFMSINSCVQQLSSSFASFIGGSIVIKDGTGKLWHYQYVGYIAIGATLLTIVLSRKLKVIDDVNKAPIVVIE